MKHEALGEQHTALKTSEGAWVMDAQGKANFFADTFAGKCKFLRLRRTYTECAQLRAAVACPTVEQCMAVLAGLCDDSSTSPDLVPTRFLKRCAKQLAKPLQSLLQRMTETASWPESWRVRSVVTIYKKECRFRGRQLQRQLQRHRAVHQSHSCFLDQTSSPTSKAVERGTGWPTSRCRGFLGSIAARTSPSTAWTSPGLSNRARPHPLGTSSRRMPGASMRQASWKSST